MPGDGRVRIFTSCDRLDERHHLVLSRRGADVGRQPAESLRRGVVERSDDHKVRSAKVRQNRSEPLFVRRDLRRGLFDVEVERASADDLEYLSECRDAVSPIGRCTAAQGVVVLRTSVNGGFSSDEPVRVVEPAQLVERHRRDRPRTVCRPVDRRIVANDELSVFGRVDVELDAGRSDADRPLNRVERRGRRLELSALMGIGDDPALEPWIGHLRFLSAPVLRWAFSPPH